MGDIYWIARDPIEMKILFYKKEYIDFEKLCKEENKKGTKYNIYHGYFNPIYAEEKEYLLDNDTSKKYILTNIIKGDEFRVAGKISMYNKCMVGDILIYKDKKKNGEIILTEITDKYTISIPTYDGIVPAIKDKQIIYIK